MGDEAKERRKHKRFDLACPVVIYDSQGQELLRTRTINVSDGGALLAASGAQAIPVGEIVQVALHVPRQTPNTRMLEDFFSAASVVRHQDLPDEEQVGIALMFDRPLLLKLDA